MRKRAQLRGDTELFQAADAVPESIKLLGTSFTHDSNVRMLHPIRSLLHPNPYPVLITVCACPPVHYLPSKDGQRERRGANTIDSPDAAEARQIRPTDTRHSGIV